jgi:transposase
MAAPRLVGDLTIEDEDVTRLMAIARSRTEPASRVERARMLLAYRDDPSFFGVGRLLGVHHQTVQRCIERAAALGPLAALDDSARPGKTATITAKAKAWLVSLACQKAKDFGYPHELWTTRLLARHAREYGPAAGHECLAKWVQGSAIPLYEGRCCQAKNESPGGFLVSQPDGSYGVIDCDQADHELHNVLTPFGDGRLRTR